MVCKQYIVLNHALSEKTASFPQPFLTRFPAAFAAAFPTTFPTEFLTAFPTDDLHILKISCKISCRISCMISHKNAFLKPIVN